jgi:hypothetical protein
MYDIPLDLERRFERRSAARFAGPLKEHRLEELSTRHPAPQKQKKNPPTEQK